MNINETPCMRCNGYTNTMHNIVEILQKLFENKPKENMDFLIINSKIFVYINIYHLINFV